MLKAREMTDKEGAPIEFLQQGGHSYSEIARRVCCSIYTADRNLNTRQKQVSIEKRKESKRPKTIYEKEKENNKDLQEDPFRNAIAVAK